MMTIMDFINDLKIGLEAGEKGFLQRLFDNFATLKNHPLIEKVQKVVTLLFSSHILSNLGLDIKIESLLGAYAGAFSVLKESSDLIGAILDLVAFVIGRVTQCIVTRSFSPFWHSDKTYADWTDKAFDVLEKGHLLHDPKANGFTYHEFLKNLNDAIKDGEEIKKFVKDAGHKDVVSSVLSRLRLLKGEVLVKNSAGKDRKAPFCVLLAGGSSVGKSTLTRLLIHHYGKVFGLKTGPDYIYTRTFTDDYWSGFNSEKWAIILDDVAYVNPNKGTEDRSLSEILQIANNAAFCPPQADTADKGKTPVLAELVIGTTNTAHMNAQFWFSNPVAVRRRFPYIVTVAPLGPYARSDAPAMLDPTKLPALEEGEYPNYWHLVVEKVLVVDNGQVQTTRNVRIAEFVDIYEFVQWFATAARDYHREQGFVDLYNDTLSKVEVCTLCYVPEKHCKCVRVQGAEMYEDTGNQVICAAAAVGSTALVLMGKRFIPRFYAAGREFLYRKVDDLALAYATRTRERLVSYSRGYVKKILSKAYKSVMTRPEYRMVAKATAAASVLIMAYAAYRKYHDMTTTDPLSGMSVNAREVESFGVTPDPKGDQQENFYYQKDDFRRRLPVTENITSWRKENWMTILNKLKAGVVSFTTRRPSGDGRTIKCNGKALCIGGRLFVTDNHLLPEVDFEITLVREKHSNGLTTNVKRQMSASLVYRLPEKELAFFQVLDSFDCKDVSPFITKGYPKIEAEGALIERDDDGNVDFWSLIRIHDVGHLEIPTESRPLVQCYEYDIPHHSTYVGLCGSPIVARTSAGPTIVGLHTLGRGDGGMCVNLDHSDILLARKHFFPVFSGQAPMLNAKEKVVRVDPLHFKSIFRFLHVDNDGSNHGREQKGRIFGQLSLGRSQAKSRVERTAFYADAIESGWDGAFGAPVMSGRDKVKVWRNSVLPIVETKFGFDEKLFAVCAETYMEECFMRLTRSDRDELKNPLSVKAAVNGVPTTKFIDSINRQSGAGFPWNCPKSKLWKLSTPDDTWQDPIEFNDEVMDRVEEMYNRYVNFNLVHPVFTAHLKDEVLPKRKIDSCKTRVMNGAPVDWALLVRMVYLPFVRVLQNNSYVFEAMPGIVAQSKQWTELRKYVVSKGEDRIIAGDYSNFDKNMGATAIMYAFKVIIDIVQRSGASEEQIRVMWGVAYDTSCSFCNYAGDLVQFFGSNPSGHPLTVIINCIVNSIYVRYAYAVLGAEERGDTTYECHSFRENVALATYGDDNIMSSSVDWFNHTALSRVLAGCGVGYTMADKSSISRPFIHIDEASFLKRSWRLEPDLGEGAYACPLEEATLSKMMTYWLDKNDMSIEKRISLRLSEVWNEYFWYGREKFEEKALILQKIHFDYIPEAYWSQISFPSWGELCAKWERQ
jgi:hypothetical protein